MLAESGMAALGGVGGRQRTFKGRTKANLGVPRGIEDGAFLTERTLPRGAHCLPGLRAGQEEDFGAAEVTLNIPCY